MSENSNKPSNRKMETQDKLTKQTTLLSFITRSKKDEVSVSTGSGQNVVSNIAENSSANLASFEDFPDDIIDSAASISKTDLACAINDSNSIATGTGLPEFDTSQMDSTVSSSHDLNDITPLYKGLDFDFDAQFRKLKHCEFPYTGTGKNKRCFQLAWMTKFKWIEYSTSKDAAFCNTCRQFGTESKDTTFTLTGFNKWRAALDPKKDFHRHESSAIHSIAEKCKLERLNRIRTDTAVSTSVNSTVLSKRRYYVTSVIKTIIFLVDHHLPLRGEWDDEANEEYSLFNSLFAYAVERNSELADCQKYMPANATYKSPAIQNEIIEILTRLLRKNIIREVMGADVDFFTILFDGTKDKHGDEIISLAARFVSCGKVFEALLFFETTVDQDAEAFTKLMLESLNSYELDAMRILSQCYDGASVMNGYKSGVAKRLQDALKKVFPYIHCFNHRLHLVIIYLVKQIQAIREFFDQLQLTYTTLRKPKIRKIHTGKSMKRLIETRWCGHKDAAKCMSEDYVAFVETLRQAVKNTFKDIDGEDIAVSIGILAVITGKKFVFILVVINELLSVLAPADTIFQKRDIGYKRAMPVIESVKSTILDYRTNEHFKIFEDRAKVLLNETVSSGSNVSRPVRKNRSRSTLLKDFVVEESLGERSDDYIELKSVYFEIIDVIVAELNSRFSENNDILLALCNADNMDLNKLKPLENLGIQLPSNSELRVAKKYVATKMKDEKHRKSKSGRR